MKKKLFLAGTALICACAVGTAMKVSSSTSKSELISLNVEALACDEGLSTSLIAANCEWAETENCEVTAAEGCVWDNSNMKNK